jgi:nitrogenase molybdenum-iron protein alpha chain
MVLSEKDIGAILESYPAKVKRNRKNHILIKDSTQERQVIEANTRTIPGIITNRGWEIGRASCRERG